MKILDLFSGCGGLSEGFRADPFDTIAHIEMDAAACESLITRSAYYYLKENNNSHIYESYLEGKINKKTLYNELPSSEMSKILNLEISSKTINQIFSEVDAKLNENSLDGIIGGPPCQAYSTIGRARNKDNKAKDERIYLYEYYVDFLERYQPTFFLFENVKGLLSYRDQYDELLFPKILEEFRNVGYSIDHSIINASDYGVSQNRERLFIFGLRNDYDENRQNQINYFESLARLQQHPICVNELFEDLPFVKDGETINHYISGPTNLEICSYYRKDNLCLSQNISRKHNSRDKEIYFIVSEKKEKGIQLRYNDLPERLKTHNNTTSFVDRFKAIDGEGYSHTVVAHISKDGHYYIHPDKKQNRSITVREAARLQSFPDDFYFESSRSAAYKQIGNAVPPKLSEKLAKVIKEEILG